MKNVKLSVLLFSSYGLIIFGLIVVLVFSFTRMSNINEQSTIISEDWLPSVKLIGSIDTQTAELRNLEAVHILYDTVDEKVKLEKVIEDQKNSIEQTIRDFSALVSDNNEEIKLLKQFEASYKDYLSIENKVFTLSRQDEDDAARSLFLLNRLKSIMSTHPF